MSDTNILRRIAERGLKKAQDSSADFVDLFQHMLDELERFDKESQLTAGIKAASDVLAERARQKSIEGWTPEHDDRHSAGQMAAAAGVYALHAGGYSMQMVDGAPSAYWPWEPKWWKPADARRNLVKSAALILAEIERIDRAVA